MESKVTRRKRQKSTSEQLRAFQRVYTGTTFTQVLTEPRQQLLFPPVGGKKVVGKFDGGDITSDAGLLLLK